MFLNPSKAHQKAKYHPTCSGWFSSLCSHPFLLCYQFLHCILWLTYSYSPFQKLLGERMCEAKKEDMYARCSVKEHIPAVKLLKLCTATYWSAQDQSTEQQASFFFCFLVYEFCFLFSRNKIKKNIESLHPKGHHCFQFPLTVEAAPALAGSWSFNTPTYHFKTGISWRALIQATCSHQASIYLNVTSRIFRVTGMSFWSTIYTVHYTLHDVQPRHSWWHQLTFQ